MDKASAAAILKSAVSFDAHIGSILHQIELLEDGEEKQRLHKAIGEVMLTLTRHIIFPIVRQYPELDPDKK
jgi:hypothetical protein